MRLPTKDQILKYESGFLCLCEHFGKALENESSELYSIPSLFLTVDSTFEGLSVHPNNVFFSGLFSD